MMTAAAMAIHPLASNSKKGPLKRKLMVGHDTALHLKNLRANLVGGLFDEGGILQISSND